MKSIKLSELASLVKAELHGGADPNLEISGVAPIETARAGELTFVASAEFAKHAAATNASVLITATLLPDAKCAQLVHKNPYWAFAKVAQIFVKEERHAPGVDSRAFVSPEAKLGTNVSIMPFAYVSARANIGNDCVIFPGSFIGADVEIGEGSVIRANVTIEYGCKIGKRALIHGGTVIGADGFGFAPGEGGLAKVPQTGAVTIGDDVEIGAGVSIDRGAMLDTKVGNGTKIDSHVHVAHNVIIGNHCMLCGMSAVAGSAKLGNGVVLAGHACVSNRVEIADGVQVGALTGVTKDLDVKGGMYCGFPAVPLREWRRQIVHTRRLPETESKISELEGKLKDLEAKFMSLAESRV